ncbi:RNA polymerase sigma-70 factor (ECF subfamily) [Mucilaginibacter yixingensis]|uniref:RNA polymerase sigma-70 factor (ECF subfamily) n=1 Tax=Mucilaginibacter yixingensis TaxID=1295612 RepID=A0A2T5JGL0_9SPHI|nr:RNA polymerase sigma-70 factor [Mucilaginibacter yixingensis]PTR01558.1 RNA polymerase sigma-70 factor (ECF subfamily) [Mucilaginibacter yixingensis]
MPQCIDIANFRNGDVNAFKLIFEEYYQRLSYFTRTIVGDEEAEDIVQETFVKLWERADTFDNTTSIKAFLYLTAKNACLNVTRHNKIIKLHETQATEVSEDNLLFNIIRHEVIGEIRAAVDQLPEGYRKVIYLSYFEGKTNQETAEMLNISINTVKTQKLRGFKILREVLKHSPEGLLILSAMFHSGL